MQFPKHFPLNSVDTINKPPLHFLQIQDGLQVISGITWTIAYVLYIKQSNKDKSYGMPMIALSANIGWELLYSVFYPLAKTEMIAYAPWLLLDCFLVRNTLKFGPEEWKSAPVIAHNIGYVFAVSFTAIVGLQWALILTLGDSYHASFWTGFGCQALLGCSSVAQLLSRNDTRGHSMMIWALRFVGSFGAGVMFRYRYECYPEDYWYAGTPLATAVFIIAAAADISYPFVYMFIERQGGKSKKFQ